MGETIGGGEGGKREGEREGQKEGGGVEGGRGDNRRGRGRGRRREVGVEGGWGHVHIKPGGNLMWLRLEGGWRAREGRLGRQRMHVHDVITFCSNK